MHIKKKIVKVNMIENGKMKNLKEKEYFIVVIEINRR